MSNIVEAARVVPLPVSKVFGYVDDYRNVPKWMFGVLRFDPRGEQSSGLGAIFDVSVRLGVPLKSRVEVIAWEQDRLIVLKAIKGFDATSSWFFEETGDGGTRMGGKIEYTLPGGPAGKAIGKAIEPLIGRAVTSTTNDLEEQLLALP